MLLAFGTRTVAGQPKPVTVFSFAARQSAFLLAIANVLNDSMILWFNILR